jgi:hypothetical protein
MGDDAIVPREAGSFPNQHSAQYLGLQKIPDHGILIIPPPET